MLPNFFDSILVDFIYYIVFICLPKDLVVLPIQGNLYFCSLNTNHNKVYYFGI